MSRLLTLVAEAEASLPEPERDALADLVESFIAARDEAALFTPRELDDLRRIDGETDDLASPEDVAAVLARRG